MFWDSLIASPSFLLLVSTRICSGRHSVPIILPIQVAFVTILKAVERLEGKSERRRRELGAVGVTASDGGEGGMRPPGQHRDAAGPPSSAEQELSTSTLPNTGDALIANFQEVSAPILGNSVVRVGRCATLFSFC